MKEKRLNDTRAAVMDALADPEDEREPGRIELDYGLAPGSIKKLMGDSPEFREELEDRLRRQASLERMAVIKSLSRQARQGSVQHQKYYLDLLEKLSGREGGEAMTVELVIVDAAENDEH